MRIGQAWQGIRDRWSRADSSGVSVVDMIPVVQPVCIVGYDEADASVLRAVFLQGDDPDREVAIVANTVGIRVVRVSFQNLSAAPQIMRARVSVRSIPEADEFTGARSLLQSSDGDARFREGFAASVGFPFVEALAAGARSEWFELGLILQPGQALCHKNPDAGVESTMLVEWTEYA